MSFLTPFAITLHFQQLSKQYVVEHQYTFVYASLIITATLPQSRLQPTLYLPHMATCSCFKFVPA